MTKPTPKKKKENKQVIEIHIYVHQVPLNPAGVGGLSVTTQCTCSMGVSAPVCPIHGRGNYPYATCKSN